MAMATILNKVQAIFLFYQARQVGPSIDSIAIVFIIRNLETFDPLYIIFQHCTNCCVLLMFIKVCSLYIYLIHVVKKFCACILFFALSPLSLLVLFYHSFNFFGMPPALACMKKSNITNMPTLELPHSTFATLPRFGLLFIRVGKK